jgi:two-component system CheB/CheR fusion protein
VLQSSLVRRDDIHGLLAVYRRGQAASQSPGEPAADPPDPDEPFLLSVLADQAAIALSHALSYRKQRWAAQEALHKIEAELAEAHRHKDEFLSMLGHELRNPLAPVLNAVQTMRLRGSTDPVMQRAEGVIERQVRHMARLLDDLLDASRITRGKIPLRKVPTSLFTAVQDVLQIERANIEKRGHTLHAELSPEPIWVDVDPARFAQVLSNLLDNAAKYTEPGGKIWVSSAREGAAAVVRVRDTGMGIPPELLPHVFELFTQGERSADRSEGGLGIGLTLVRKLVELHGGQVQALSDGRGRGSEFVVTLPAMAGPPAVASTGANAPKPSRKLHILVVDDNIDVAEVMAELIRVAGHRTDVAHDGPAAIAAVRAQNPDVVLLDIGLPGMDGYEVARRLREELGNTAPLIVALTGYGRESDALRTKMAGFSYHLVKPAEWADLERIFASVKPRLC